jgi:hypothetical protein
MDAWSTHCPRLSIWEDALGDGLVRVHASQVELTPRGETLIYAYDRASGTRAQEGSEVRS